MKINIIDYDKKEHENFVKSYIVSYIMHGFIYDLSPDKRKLLISKLINDLDFSVIKMAVDADNVNQYLGFAIAEDNIVPTLKFIYVKKNYQRLGVGTALLGEVLDCLIDTIYVPMKTPNLNLFFKSKQLKAVVRFYSQLGL